jgi:hypothetical protein
VRIDIVVRPPLEVVKALSVNSARQFLSSISISISISPSMRRIRADGVICTLADSLERDGYG